MILFFLLMTTVQSFASDCWRQLVRTDGKPPVQNLIVIVNGDYVYRLETGKRVGIDRLWGPRQFDAFVGEVGLSGLYRLRAIHGGVIENIESKSREPLTIENVVRLLDGRDAVFMYARGKDGQLSLIFDAIQSADQQGFTLRHGERVELRELYEFLIIPKDLPFKSDMMTFPRR